jgi:hypothetical protein
LRTLIVLVAMSGVVAWVVASVGNVIAAVIAGLACLLVALVTAAAALHRRSPEARGQASDPSRRRFLLAAGLSGLLWTFAGSALGWAGRKVLRPDPVPIQQDMATSLGGEYMEMIRRSFMRGRSGDVQLLLAPYNSANYENESLSLVPRDPRSSHASTWLYLERVPLVVYGPGQVAPLDSEDRVTLADIAPTQAALMDMQDWPAEREGRALPGLRRTASKPPKVIVTFVIDGGGWNVLNAWPGRWPNLERLMQGGANYRNAIHGSYPAVTACGHASIGTGTYPDQHGITGHNIRVGAGPRKAYGEPGQADPSDILVPTLSDLWYERSGGKAWVGEIGYQVWHMGMLGFGGRDRTDDSKPVCVYWNEGAAVDGKPGEWASLNPEIWRLPAKVPGLDVYEQHLSAFDDPGWDAEFTPSGGGVACCSPPIVAYQGDLIEATFDSEPIGQTGSTDLLFTTYKSPDYTGHIYGMASKWVGLQLEEVDAQLGRLVDMLEARFPGEYVIIATADHGQCPLPDSVGGVRLDPIQLQEHITSTFGGLPGTVVQSVVPHEIYLDTDVLRRAGDATVDDVAVSLRHYRYRQNIGPYVPRDAIEQDLLDREEFAAVFGTEFLDTLATTDLSSFGPTAYPQADPEGMGSPPGS